MNYFITAPKLGIEELMDTARHIRDTDPRFNDAVFYLHCAEYGVSVVADNRVADNRGLADFLYHHLFGDYRDRAWALAGQELNALMRRCAASKAD